MATLLKFTPHSIKHGKDLPPILAPAQQSAHVPDDAMRINALDGSVHILLADWIVKSERVVIEDVIEDGQAQAAAIAPVEEAPAEPSAEPAVAPAPEPKNPTRKRRR